MIAFRESGSNFDDGKCQQNCVSASQRVRNTHLYVDFGYEIGNYVSWSSSPFEAFRDQEYFEGINRRQFLLVFKRPSFLPSAESFHRKGIPSKRCSSSFPFFFSSHRFLAVTLIKMKSLITKTFCQCFKKLCILLIRRLHLMKL